MILQQVMDSQAKIRLLEKLADRTGSFSISDLSRFSDLPKSTVSLVVVDWEKAGLVHSRVHGRNKIVAINRKFYLLPEIKKIIGKTKDFNRPLINKVMSLKILRSRRVKAVVAFGSRMGKDFTAQSDLDVLIVLDDTHPPVSERLVEEFVKLTNETDIRHSPVLMSPEDFAARVEEKDHFIKNVLGQGNILKGVKWIEHIQASPRPGK